ncbi:Pol protein [Phytophthora palmivora]|uniref:Pol protein n=1 Tax=Phytophthora palmivora TaxID=4796 RepID=A0A2P4XIN0_9STRA|nr:Pol protein [Phytophthora palmivora]
MVLLKPETSPEDLNSPSVMDVDVLEGFTKQRATRLGSEILKNPEDPVYPLVKEYSDVVSKHPPSQLPPDRGTPIPHKDLLLYNIEHPEWDALGVASDVTGAIECPSDV